MKSNFEKAYFEEIKYYIENDIDYIERYGYEEEKKDLKFLKSLTDKDIEILVDKVLNDDELNEERNNTIHHYLYHYRKEV